MMKIITQAVAALLIATTLQFFAPQAFGQEPKKDTTQKPSDICKQLQTPLSDTARMPYCDSGQHVFDLIDKSLRAEFAVPTSPVLPNSKEKSRNNPVATTVSSAPESSDDGIVLNANVLFDLVNGYRAASDLSPFEKEERVCKVAQDRAPELLGEIASGNFHAGFRARVFDYWITENVIYQRSEQGALSWWTNSPIHNAALLGDYQYSCVACYGRACTMLFTNFTPKFP